MAVLDPNPYPLSPANPGTPWQDWPAHQEFTQLRETSLNLPDGQIVGALLSWPRADGYAHYLVTNDNPLTLTWVPYLDAWSVETPLIRGLERDDILAMIARDKRLAELTGQREPRP